MRRAIDWLFCHQPVISPLAVAPHILSQKFGCFSFCFFFFSHEKKKKAGPGGSPDRH